jgi:hypothetical protein
MESKQFISIETTKADFTFRFQMQAGSSWGNAIDAAYEILQLVSRYSQQSIENNKPQGAQDANVG